MLTLKTIFNPSAKRILFVLLLFLFAGGLWFFRTPIRLLIQAPEQGVAIDSLHGVYVYYNGPVSHVGGRHLSADGYNLGLKYQCVEFVKRYYYEHYKHKMPDSYGHAVSFFDPSLKDSAYNAPRNLFQYTNPGRSRPRTGDLLVYSGTDGNPYGHVAIVSQVFDDAIEIIQQNPGIGAASRQGFPLTRRAGLFQIENDRILGWLRKQ
jgi:CHAP domain